MLLNLVLFLALSVKQNCSLWGVKEYESYPLVHSRLNLCGDMFLCPYFVFKLATRSQGLTRSRISFWLILVFILSEATVVTSGKAGPFSVIIYSFSSIKRTLSLPSLYSLSGRIRTGKAAPMFGSFFAVSEVQWSSPSPKYN